MNIQEKYEIGLPVFIKLFDMNSNKLKETLKEICGSLIDNDDLFIKGVVTKIIKDDKADSLSVSYYGSELSISPFGIKHKSEYNKHTQLIEFNKYFKI